MKYSVVIPIHNEERNILPLYKRIKEVMDQLGDYEIIYVDDGSKDGSFQVLEELHSRDKNVKVIKQSKNFGQSSALDAGIGLASGDVIITMDGDMQNDPADIPRLVKKLNNGYEVVSGWRCKRRDPVLKIFFSGISRMLRRIIIKDSLHDSGCALKAYRRECFEDFQLHGEMHRYIAELLALRGFKIGEVRVRHLQRRHGNTKYGADRIFKGFLDLFLVWFWQKYSGRPLHLFGGMGLLSILVGLLSVIYVFYDKIMYGRDLSNNFLSYLSVFLIVIGIQFFVSGIITDILIRDFYKEKKMYKIRKILK